MTSLSQKVFTAVASHVAVELGTQREVGHSRAVLLVTCSWNSNEKLFSHALDSDRFSSWKENIPKHYQEFYKLVSNIWVSTTCSNWCDFVK